MKCRFCGGRGCIACSGERKRLEKEALKPLFVAKTLEDIELLAEAVGRKAIEKAFTPDAVYGHVPGMQQIEGNLAIASLIQHLREQRSVSQTSDGSGGNL